MTNVRPAAELSRGILILAGLLGPMLWTVFLAWLVWVTASPVAAWAFFITTFAWPIVGVRIALVVLVEPAPRRALWSLLWGVLVAAILSSQLFFIGTRVVGHRTTPTWLNGRQPPRMNTHAHPVPPALRAAVR